MNREISEFEALPPPDGDPVVAGDPHEAAARDWLANVYQGDRVRQLSVRSIVTGMLIGGVMSISNLYVGLKTGWNLGVTITACIIAYAVFKSLENVIPAFRRQPFTVLENYTMSSAASAAGYMSAAGLVSAFPALYLATGRELLWWEIMSWLSAVSLLGVFMAIPLKRQLINIDQLPFPSGIATAETLESMHSEGSEAIDKARALFWSAGIGAALAFWRDGWQPFFEWIAARFESTQAGVAQVCKRIGSFAFPGEIPLIPGKFGHYLAEELSLGFEGSLVMVAAGAIIGLRVGVSLLVGAIVYYGVLGPILIDRGLAEPGYKGIVAWTLWPATAMMVTSGFLGFAFRWRTIVRAFSGLTSMFGRGGQRRDDPLARVEVPASWFIVGTLVSGTACVLLGHFMFDITWWMGILAVLLTFILSIVAARATGETDVTPIGALGKITQLTYGVIAPSNLTTNLMTASITAGAAAHSADLLTDLKSGYMLGGNPRMQTISQLFGVLAGTLICVPVYMVIAEPSKLGSKELPAPSAKVWASVAQMIAAGFGPENEQDSAPPKDTGPHQDTAQPAESGKPENQTIHPPAAASATEKPATGQPKAEKPKRLDYSALVAMAIGGVIGIILTVAEEFSPPAARKWIPSVVGLGIAGVIPAFNSISMFLGALIAWIVARSSPKTDEKYTIAVASGLIAGESLMGVTVRLCQAGPGLIMQMLGAGKTPK